MVASVPGQRRSTGSGPGVHAPCSPLHLDTCICSEVSRMSALIAGHPSPPAPPLPRGPAPSGLATPGKPGTLLWGPGWQQAKVAPQETRENRRFFLSEAVVLGIVFSIIKNTKRLPNRTKSSHSVPARPPAALLARPPHAAGTAARMPRSPSPRPPVQSWPLASLGPAASHLCPPGPWPGAQNCTAPRDPWEQRADGLAPRTWGRWLGGAPLGGRNLRTASP